ncbi:hypothetical protein [Salininema proteolyticum]|uniref:DUF4179 domain-containing protein n=1 Tax=Salininema proteolyticum TaxID=1607685 RepID=A0ABV8TTC0_9ACTN
MTEMNKRGFEDRLLRELKNTVRENNRTPARRFTGFRRYSLAGALAAAVVGVGVAVVPPLVESEPAYAVELVEDGVINIALYDVDAAKDLEKELNELGVSAKIAVTAPGEYCSNWFGSPDTITDLSDLEDNGSDNSDKPSVGISVRPEDRSGGEEMNLVIEIHRTSESDSLRYARVLVAWTELEFDDCEPVAMN